MFFKGVDGYCSGHCFGVFWNCWRLLAELDWKSLVGELTTWEGIRLGRSGLETLMVILLGLGDTDLNHTVLLGTVL